MFQFIFHQIRWPKPNQSNVDNREDDRKYFLRADVSKYRPEAYKSEKLKNPKKIHRVALVELLSEIHFLFRFDDYY